MSPTYPPLGVVLLLHAKPGNSGLAWACSEMQLFGHCENRIGLILQTFLMLYCSGASGLQLPECRMTRDPDLYLFSSVSSNESILLSRPTQITSQEGSFSAKSCEAPLPLARSFLFSIQVSLSHHEIAFVRVRARGQQGKRF